MENNEYGMVCIECLEEATENVNGEWYCTKHVPQAEKQWGGAREGAGRPKGTAKGTTYQEGYNAGYQAGKRENAGRKRDWWKFRLMTEAREIEGQRLHRGVVLYDGNVFWQDKRWYASFEPALQCADEIRDRLYRDMSVPESEAGYLDKEIRRFRRVEFELTPEQRAEIAQPVHIEQ